MAYNLSFDAAALFKDLNNQVKFAMAEALERTARTAQEDWQQSIYNQRGRGLTPDIPGLSGVGAIPEFRHRPDGGIPPSTHTNRPMHCTVHRWQRTKEDANSIGTHTTDERNSSI